MQMTDKNQIRTENVRFRVLRSLQESPRASQRDIAKALDISLGGVNYCLSALIEQGQINMGSFQETNDKRKYVYLLTPKGVAEQTSLAGRFLQRKMRKFEAPKEEIAAVRKELTAVAD